MRVVLLLLMMFVAAQAANAVEPWYAFGQYKVGMSRDAAKQNGLNKCDFGKKGDVFEKQDVVYCDLAPSTFAGQTISGARGAFPPPKHDVLTEIRFEIPQAGYPSKCKLIEALQSQVGGNVLYDGHRHFPCRRELNKGGPEVVRLSDHYMGSTVKVTISFDPKGIEARRKWEKAQKEQLAKDDAKKKSLEGFK